MEAPKPISLTPEGKLIFIPSKEFELSQNNNKYHISIGISSIDEKLGLLIKDLSSDLSNYYENFYSLEELRIISKYFRLFDTIKEIISFIEEKIEEKNIIIKNGNNNISLNIKINKIGKGEELISLELKEKPLSLQEICNNLSNEIKNLKSKVIDLELTKNREIDELKNEIKIIKDENKMKDKIINDLLNWQKQIDKKILENNNIIINEELKEKEIEIKKDDNKELKVEEHIENIKINNDEKIESKIIEEKEDINFLIKRLKEIESFKNNNILFELIFRGTRDGNLVSDFHKKCDGIPKTITLIKTIKGIIFGGYIDKKWFNKGGWIKDDENCFLFSINNKKIYNSIKEQKKYNLGENLIFAEFGVKDNLFEKSSLNILKKDEANKYFSGFSTDYEINGGEREFQIEELEAFQIISK